ncbi:MAG TPA: protease modulator HflC [Thermoanaerobaculia bacterium]|jgi:membrane protease subunit HflC|nr:protease modulator HflC [Thermoanaerobaculia bacterium]
MNRIRRALILAGTAMAAALLLTAFYTVGETEMAIVTRFGRPLPHVARPGLHVKLPWPVDSVVRLDARLLIFDGEPTEMLTADKKNVLIDSFVCWRIADPLLFAQTVKTRAEAEARLLDLSSSEMGAAVGREPMESFLRAGGPVKLRAVSRRVGAAVGALARHSFGIAVLDLQISGFNLPPQNRASVIERMRAERARIATGYRSEGEEAALKIQAEAAAEREKILSEARAQAEAVRGQGEAEALRTFADAYSKDPDFYRFLRSLESYETILDDKTTIFLQSDSKLLKALDGQ